GRIYEFERRMRSPDLTNAIDLVSRALNLTVPGDHSAAWGARKYHLALLQQVEARRKSPTSRKLFSEAIANAQEALKYTGDTGFDKASCAVVLGNAYMGRGEVQGNKNWQEDINAAISIFEDVAHNPLYDNLNLHRSHIYNNISSAYRYMAQRSADE